MIPGERLSTTTFKGDLYNPWSRDPHVSLHWGPVAIQDPSQGLGVHLWRLRTINNGELLLSASGVAEFPWYTHTAKLSAVSLAFDQNARPVITFTDELGASYMRWFDPTVNQTVTVALPYATTPRVTLDDARAFNVGNSDVILGYTRAGLLRYRRQRDRFDTEFTPTIGDGGSPAPANALRHISMNSNLRLEFLTDDAGDEEWTLAEVAADLLARSGIEPQHIDTRHLYDQMVEGYRVATEGGADTMLEPLQAAYFFDPAQWDKKLRFIPRGGEPVATIHAAELLERDSEDGPLEIERVQEIELLRKVNVTMVDSTAGWVPNKQTSERISATIQARGESSSVIPLTATPDFIATVAQKRLRIPWGEPHKFNYKLGIPWSALTPTDVVTLVDEKGVSHRMRLMRNNEDYGTLSFEASSDAPWVYDSKAAGTLAPPSPPPVPGRVGDTLIAVMDLPVLRDQDDELGYYVAVHGEGNGWNGGIVEMSTDGGATIQQSVEVDMPAVAGRTLTPLAAEHSSEYLSSQTLRVEVSGPLESVNRENLLRNRNLAALQRADGSWEVLQFQTATVVTGHVYELSGLVRGRYATEPLSVPADAVFVLIDSAVMFVQIQQWMLGQTLHYRAISYGQNPDDVEWKSFTVGSPMSQTEWPVHMVRRDGDTVSWIGRARLGVESAPHHSRYFAGYRVTYSDGHTADTTAQSYTRTDTPAGVTVTVEPVNSITGTPQ